MNLSLLLWTSFTALVGLQLCIPETPNGKFEKEYIEENWTSDPWLRIAFGLSNIIGVVFVLGIVGYLTFTQHWWYIAVYIGGVLVAKLVVLLLRMALYPIEGMLSYIPPDDIARLHRIVGMVIIYTSIAICIIP